MTQLTHQVMLGEPLVFFQYLHLAVALDYEVVVSMVLLVAQVVTVVQAVEAVLLVDTLVQ